MGCYHGHWHGHGCWGPGWWDAGYGCGPGHGCGPGYGYGAGYGHDRSYGPRYRSGRRRSGRYPTVSREAAAAEMETYLASLRDEIRAVESDLADIAGGAAETGAPPQV